MKKYFFIIFAIMFLALGCDSPEDNGVVGLDGPILESVDSNGMMAFNGAVITNADTPVHSLSVVIVLNAADGNCI